MFNNTKEKNKALKEREQHLKMMKACLELYKKNKDEELIKFAKWLGTVTQEIKQDIDNNNLDKYKSIMDDEEYLEFRKNPIKWYEEHNLT